MVKATTETKSIIACTTTKGWWRMKLIDADLLLSCIGDRYTEKKEIVPNNLAEGFVQVENSLKNSLQHMT